MTADDKMKLVSKKSVSYTHLDELRVGIGKQSENNGRKRTVSYTHLDVYKRHRQGRVFLDGKTVLIDEENTHGALWQETVGEDGAPRPETKARENNLLWLETEARGDGGLELRIYSENRCV